MSSSTVYARKPRLSRLPRGRETQEEEEDGDPSFMPVYMAGGNRLLEIKSGAEVNREFWSRWQSGTFTLLGLHLVLTCFALAELAGNEVLSVGTWAMMLSVVWFISVAAAVYIRNKAKKSAHGSPKQNPVFLMLLFLAMAYSTEMVLLSVFYGSFSDEAEELDNRSAHIRPVPGLLDPRIHSVWNMIMLAVVLINFVVFCLITLVWYWRLLPKFARHVMSHSAGDAEAMAAAAMAGAINGNPRVIVNYDMGGSDELSEEDTQVEGATRESRDQMEARRLAAIGVSSSGLGDTYT